MYNLYFQPSAITCMPLNETGGISVMYSPNSPTGSNNLDFGTTATYSCTPGFRLNGNQRRECAGDGDSTIGIFDGSDPTCEGTLCWRFHTLRIRLCVSDLEEVSLGPKNEKGVFQKTAYTFYSSISMLCYPSLCVFSL